MSRTSEPILERTCAAAFKGVSEAVKHGVFERDAALAALRSCIASYFPRALCAFWYGSAHRGDAKAYSDLDLIAVLPGEAPQALLWMVHGGFAIDAKVIGLARIDAAMKADKRAGPGYLIMSFAEGEAIFGTDEIAAAISARSRAIAADGPDKPDPPQIDACRARLTSTLVELLTVSNPDEVLACATGLGNALVAAKFLILGTWPHEAKWSARKLEQLDPTFYPAYRAAFRCCLDGDTTPLATIAEDLLRKIGGPLWSGYRRMLPTPNQHMRDLRLTSVAKHESAA